MKSALKLIVVVSFGFLLLGAMATFGLMFFAGSKSLGGSPFTGPPLVGSTKNFDERDAGQADASAGDSAPSEAAGVFDTEEAPFMRASKSAGAGSLVPRDALALLGGLGERTPGDGKAAKQLSLSGTRLIDGTSTPIALGPDELEVIRSVFTSHHSETMACLNNALTRSTVVTGSINFEISVAKGGLVNSVKTSSVEITDPQLESCLGSRVKGWRFEHAPTKSVRLISASLPIHLVRER